MCGTSGHVFPVRLQFHKSNERIHGVKKRTQREERMEVFFRILHGVIF